MTFSHIIHLQPPSSQPHRLSGKCEQREIKNCRSTASLQARLVKIQQKKSSRTSNRSCAAAAIAPCASSLFPRCRNSGPSHTSGRYEKKRAYLVCQTQSWIVHHRPQPSCTGSRTIVANELANIYILGCTQLLPLATELAPV
jgi:hypothetical protein